MLSGFIVGRKSWTDIFVVCTLSVSSNTRITNRSISNSSSKSSSNTRITNSSISNSSRKISSSSNNNCGIGSSSKVAVVG